MLVPMMIKLPLEIIVCPFDPVVVRILPGTSVVGGKPDIPPVGFPVGGKKVKVWSSVVIVKGAVTLGTGIVAVPLMMMTDKLETIGSPLGPNQVVPGSGFVPGVVVGGLVVPGSSVVGGRPIVWPEHVVR